MVTNLDGQRQLVSSRAPSVSSRTSASTRRHRQPRSHYGSSSPAASTQNEYPYFALTGDVDITLTTPNGRKEQRYLLHRLILSQGSGFFEDELQDLPPRALIHQPQPVHPKHALVEDAPLDSKAISLAARQASTERARKRWCFSLDWRTHNGSAAPLLIQRPPSFATDLAPPPVSRNKPPPSSSSFFRSMANFSALNINTASATAQPDPDEEILRDYDNLFRIFYNFPPTLDSVNIAEAYTECKALLRLAELYDALEVVGPRIDYHLLRFGNRLFKQIAKYPPSYLKLGYLSRSKVIFSEALIHVVGQWPHARPQLERQTDVAVLNLIEDKVAVLDDMKARLDTKLFRLTLTTTRGEPVSPSTSFVDWLAVSLFRQWLTENARPMVIAKTPPIIQAASRFSSALVTRTASSATSRAPSRSQPQPGTASTGYHNPAPANPDKVYRLMGSSSASAYLTREDIKSFLKSAPEGLYTRDNLRRMERRTDEIKAIARDIVKPLVRNELELDLVVAGQQIDGGGRRDSGRDVTSFTGGLDYLTCTRVRDEDYPWDD